MTSLHVICGLGPPIKNPGYAYDNLDKQNITFNPAKTNFRYFILQ